MRISFILLTLVLIVFKSFSQTIITPAIVSTLVDEIQETSGLANLDGEIWTHNDSGGADKIYQINIENGEIIRDVKIDDADNDDWEDLATDENYVYIGDFGNNDGDRTNLRIYKVLRADIAEDDEVDSELIEFSYSDQTSWEANHNNHNFDCEAMVCYQGNLYLFSKNWLDYKTRMYILPTQPGTYVAQYLATFSVSCLISGAEMLPESNTLVLLGYNTNGGTFTWLFNNFEGDDFFNGDSQQFIWNLLTQSEGICFDENNSTYISSENFGSFVDPTLYHYDFEDYLTGEPSIPENNIKVYTRSENLVIQSISGKTIFGKIELINQNGVVVHQFQIQNKSSIMIPVNLPQGVYVVVFDSIKSGRIVTKVVF